MVLWDGYAGHVCNWKNQLTPGLILYLWLSKVLANERRRYTRNVSSHWLRPCLDIQTILLQISFFSESFVNNLLPVVFIQGKAPIHCALVTPYGFVELGSSLFRVLAFHLLGTKPLLEPIRTVCQLNPEEQIQWHMNQNTNVFIQWNFSENIVCEMSASPVLNVSSWV